MFMHTKTSPIKVVYKPLTVSIPNSEVEVVNEVFVRSAGIIKRLPNYQ